MFAFVLKGIEFVASGSRKRQEGNAAVQDRAYARVFRYFRHITKTNTHFNNVKCIRARIHLVLLPFKNLLLPCSTSAVPRVYFNFLKQLHIFFL